MQKDRNGYGSLGRAGASNTEVLGLNPTTVGKINIEYLLAVNRNVKAKIMKNLLGIAYLKNKLKDTILIKLI